jgi:hypothetical protein
MNTKHTPGPWNIFPHTNGRLGCTISFDGHGTDFTSTDICTVMPEDDHGCAIRVADANARLIAAAPDLLNGINALLGLLTLVCSRDDVPVAIKQALEHSHRVQEAKDALAKVQS